MREHDTGAQQSGSPDNPQPSDHQPKAQGNEAVPELDGLLLPLKDVAELTGYSRGQLRRLISSGRLPGVMEDNRGPGRRGRRGYLTTFRAVEDYVNNQPRIGEVQRERALIYWRGKTSE